MSNHTLKIPTWRVDLDAEDVTGTKYASGHAIAHIKLPRKKADTPYIIGWAGPARSGTTSLLYLLASQKKVDKAFFQPIKSILRDGGPDFELSKKHNLVCFKEVYRGCCERDDHDPLMMLLKAGVPAEKITWISILREPLQCYDSRIAVDAVYVFTPEHLQSTQRFTINLYHKYKALGVNIVPFAYDLLKMGEEEVLSALFKKAGLENLLPLNIDFDKKAIKDKLVYGHSGRQDYFDIHLKDTLERDKLSYKERRVNTDLKTTNKILALCQDDYRKFYELSKTELGL